MNILGNSIKIIRKSKKMTQKELASLTGFKQNTISNHENGNRQLDETDIRKYAKALGVSPQDLFDGSKPAKANTPSEPQSELITAINDKVVQLTTPRQEHVLEVATGQLEEQIAEQQQKQAEQIVEEDTEEHYKVDTVSSLAAGFGFAYDDNDIVTLTVANEPPRHDIASTVDGDSMLPDYQDGDVVYLVDVGFSHYSGQVCAVVVDDNTYLKKVYTEPNGLRLVSINPDYPDKFIDFPPTEDTHIKIFKVIDSDTPVES